MTKHGIVHFCSQTEHVCNKLQQHTEDRKQMIKVILEIIVKVSSDLAQHSLSSSAPATIAEVGLIGIVPRALLV